MLETPHVLVAAAIATKVTNPLISLPMAFSSHFIFERIPHWNPHLNTEKTKFGKISTNSIKIIFADTTIALISGVYFATRMLPDINRFSTLILACFLAITPDLIEAPYYFLNSKNDFIKNKWIPFKKSIQADANFLPGIINQLIIIAASVLWILN